MLIAAMLAWAWHGAEAGESALYGGLVAMLNAGLLVWRWWRGRHDYHCDGQRHLRMFHRSSLERFFIVGILLALGMSGFRLAPLAILAGFIVGQFAWIIAVATHKSD